MEEKYGRWIEVWKYEKENIKLI